MANLSTTLSSLSSWSPPSSGSFGHRICTSSSSFSPPLPVFQVLTSHARRALPTPCSIHVIHRSYDYGRFSSFAFELFGLFALFAMFLVGAAISSVSSSSPSLSSLARADMRRPCQTFWGNLFWCHRYWQCRVLTVMVAFAWMCWVMTFALLIVNILFAVANSAFFRPLHGRYDPHASYYNARECSLVSEIDRGC